MTDPMSGWQPISTAPKDGTAILIYEPADESRFNEASIYVCRWESHEGMTWKREHGPGAGAWTETEGEQFLEFDPTHWMPLPEAPK